MSWSFKMVGTVPAVLGNLKQIADSNPSAHLTAHHAIQQIKTMNTTRGVLVESYGHHDDFGNSYLKIETIDLAVEQQAPAETPQVPKTEELPPAD